MIPRASAWLLLLFSRALAVLFEQQLLLYAEDLALRDRRPLAALWHTEGEFEVSDMNDALPPGEYCVGAALPGKNYSCFSYIDLASPWHYDLVVDTDARGNIIKLSLRPNPATEGLRPVVRQATPGPHAAITKLRKRTKTYEDRKAGAKSATAAFEEDIEPDNRSFLMKNWKLVLIGIVVYVLMGSAAKKEGAE